jgi:hypothetical protein
MVLSLGLLFCSAGLLVLFVPVPCVYVVVAL